MNRPSDHNNYAGLLQGWKRNFPAMLEPALRQYLLGQVTSFTGAWAQNVALNLVVWQLTESAWLLGVLNFLLYGPMLFVAPIAGGRLSHQRVKTILLIVLIANAAISAALWWYAASKQADLMLLCSLALCSGALSAIELPSRLVFITASLSDRSLMTNALSLNVLANNFGRMAGAPIGAGLYSMFGPGAAFAACMFALIFMATKVMSIPVVAGKGLAQGRGGLREGLRYVKTEPIPSFFLPAVGLIGLFASSYPTLVPILAGSDFGNASRFTGLFLSCAGGGAVVASLTLASRLGPKAASHFILFSHWVICLSLAGVAISFWPACASVAFFCLGACITFTNAVSSATMLQRCPDNMRGPIAGLYSMAFAGVLPFGHLLAGALSTYFGVRATFLIMSAGLIGALLLLLALHRRKHGPSGIGPRI